MVRESEGRRCQSRIKNVDHVLSTVRLGLADPKSANHLSDASARHTQEKVSTCTQYCRTISKSRKSTTVLYRHVLHRGPPELQSRSVSLDSSQFRLFQPPPHPVVLFPPLTIPFLHDQQLSIAQCTPSLLLLDVTNRPASLYHR